MVKPVLVFAILIVGSLALVISDGKLLSTQSIFSSFGSFSTLSLIESSFISNDPQVNGDSWLLTVVQNDGGQRAVGTFVASDDGKTSDTFTLETQIIDNFVSYPVKQTGQFLFRVETETKSVFDVINTCQDRGFTNVHKPSGSFNEICYKFTSQGAKGNIDAGTLNFRTAVTVDGTRGSESCEITGTQTSCNLGIGTVNYQGSLVSGQSIPSPSGQDITAIYDTSTFLKGWKTTSASKWNTYNNYHISGLTSCLNGAFGESNSINCFNNYNTHSINAQAGKTFVSEGGQFASLSGTGSNGQIKLELGKLLQFPVLTMRIQADFLGIEIPVGQPQVVSLSTEDFQTGKSGFITAVIGNSGDARGSFDVSASCQSPFTQSGGLIRTVVEPDQTNTVFIPITANAPTDVQATCTVTATDINNPSLTSSKTITVKAKAILLCENNDKRVNGNSIEICEDNSWKLLENCGADKIAQNVNGQPQCVDKEQASGGFNFPSLSDLFGFKAGITTGLILAVIVVVGGIIVLSKIPFTISRR